VDSCFNHCVSKGHEYKDCIDCCNGVNSAAEAFKIVGENEEAMSYDFEVGDSSIDIVVESFAV
jgi:hypothetical protein